MEFLEDVGVKLFFYLIEIYHFILENAIKVYRYFYIEDKTKIRKIFFWKDDDKNDFNYGILSKNDKNIILDKEQFNNNSNNFEDINPEFVPYKFISAEIELPELSKSYQMNLEKSYFVEDNKLFTPDMVSWYLKTNYNVILNENKNYKVTIIDDMVNISNLTQDNYILIKKEKYYIK